MTATTDDVFLGGKLSILQPATGYRAGLDGVLLASAIDAMAGDKVLDAGAGVGVVGLCLAARIETALVTLVERAPVLAALARQNIVRNGCSDRARVIEADLEAPADELIESGLAPGTFDHVAANPPYIAAGRGRTPVDPIKAAANIMRKGALDVWARFLVRMVRDGGTITIIHRADALQQALGALSGRLGALDVLPILPRADKPANRILVRGIKGSRRALRLLPPLVLHGPDGNAFTPELDAILRHGAALEWPR